MLCITCIVCIICIIYIRIIYKYNMYTIFIIYITRIYNIYKTRFYNKYKFYNTLSLCIHDLCELSNPNHFLVLPLAQHLFNEMHIGTAVQFIFVESSNNRFSAKIFQKIRHWISLLHFDNFKHHHVLSNSAYNLYQKLSWICSRVPNRPQSRSNLYAIVNRD